MPGIDTHQHFWNYSPEAYPWIQKDWPIRRTFCPADLKPLLAANGFDACVAVQARQSLEETRWLLELAAANDFIAGVVGWVDLRSPEVEKQLEEFAGQRKLVGVRHVVQDEPDDNFMLRPDFLEGIERLEEFELAYDILIYPRQLPAAIQLARRFPNQRFVLDHIAKPLIREGILQPWAEQIRELAAAGPVHCKISGMVTEARWCAWGAPDFRPYLDVVWEAFGEDRLMVGSDWPVCLNSASYAAATCLARNFLEQFSAEAQAKVLAENGARFYQLQK